MSSLVRRLLIFATVEGLIFQSHGPPQHHKSLLIEYGSEKLSESNPTQVQSHITPRLEAFGLIGLINIANLPHVIAITKRKEVARVFGKPVYLITDVAILPLSSQQEANQAIKDAIGSSNHAPDEAESSGSEDEGRQTEQAAAENLVVASADEPGPLKRNNSSSTSVAEDVAKRNVSFGKFASQWLSRQRWSGLPADAEPADTLVSEPKPASKDDSIVEDVAAAQAAKEAGSSEEVSSPAKSQPPRYAATLGLLPRILRTTKMILTSGSYFFSYDFDLTRRFQDQDPPDQVLSISSLDPNYFWNRSLGARFLDSSFSPFLTPILQGFVGQRAFVLAKKSSSGSDKAEVAEVVEDASKLSNSTESDDKKQSFLLTLISRRSTKRSGLRYLRRGIDDDGYVANFAESEQILSAADWNPHLPIRTFMQIRGSIPVYFSQSPYSFKPAVVFHNSSQVNERAYEKHFQMLKRQYGAIQIALLVNRHGTEKPIGEAYEQLYSKSKEEGKAQNIDFEWFDFHQECRGMKFENVSRLVDKFEDFAEASSETVIRDGKVTSRQKGVVRTNCMDCLDRTNVAQSAFAQQKLQQSLEAEGYSIDFVEDPSTNWFNTLWADNGDAISRQYASTAALKGDYTRTRKRNWRGAMNDFGLTMSRYYSNMVNDYFSQTVIDVLLGNVGWKVFEDFESTMMSADPGVSVRSTREAAIDTCSKIVIADDEHEDILHAWTMLVPNQENTLRTLPFEEAVVLLTDAAIYCCRMDWSTEKIARYEKVDLRSVNKIKAGVYVTSTFTERQLDEHMNQGLIIYYIPGKEDLVRVNTRSLQNYHKTENDERQGVDGGTGILSWVASSVSRQTTGQEHVMALKVVPPNNDDLQKNKLGGPAQIAENVADEIGRAITGSTQHGEQRGKDLIENADIISVAEAKKRTGYLEQVGHSLRKLVWA